MDALAPHFASRHRRAGHHLLRLLECRRLARVARRSPWHATAAAACAAHWLREGDTEYAWKTELLKEFGSLLFFVLLFLLPGVGPFLRACLRRLREYIRLTYAFWIFYFLVAGTLFMLMMCRFAFF